MKEERKDVQTARLYAQLGRSIAYYRKLKGLTQWDLAEAVNMSHIQLCNLETGDEPSWLSLENLFQISDVLHVPVKEFFDF